eukprot:TRINITY_DN5856_c0_g1_i5.p1 TRINITY_DN5856_c0_g1~~TRINITY_DN5856_c0_g1_i5.p1  ORF type:complete len:660 (-),score=203.61 TRINITY_DN5856_c0_g1_i5:119-2098(-)
MFGGQQNRGTPFEKSRVEPRENASPWKQSQEQNQERSPGATVRRVLGVSNRENVAPIVEEYSSSRSTEKEDLYDGEVLLKRISKLEEEIERLVEDEREWEDLLEAERRKNKEGEIGKLRQELNESEKTIHALETQVEEIFGQVDSMTNEQDHLKKELVKMRKLNSEYERLIGTLRGEVEALSEDNANYKKLISTVDQELEKHISEVKEERPLFGIAECDFEREAKRIGRRISVLTDKLVEFSNKGNEFTDWQRRAKAAEERADESEKRLRRLDDCVREMEEQMREMEDRVREAEDRMSGAEDRARLAEESLRQKERRAIEAEREAVSLREELAKANSAWDSRVRAMTAETMRLMQTHEVDINKREQKRMIELVLLAAENERLSAIAGQKMHSMDNLRKDVKEVEELLNQREREVNELRLDQERMIARFEEEIDSLTVENDEILQELSEVKEREERTRRMREELQAKLSAAEETIILLKRKLEASALEKESERETLEEQRNCYRIELNELRMELHKEQQNVEQQLSEVRAKERRLQNEVNCLYDLLGKARREGEQLAKEGEELRRQVFRLEGEKTGLISEVERQRDQMALLASEVKAMTDMRDAYKVQVDANIGELARANHTLLEKIRELDAIRRTYDPGTTHLFSVKTIESEMPDVNGR